VSALEVSVAVMVLIATAGLAAFAAFSSGDHRIEDRITDIAAKARANYLAGSLDDDRESGAARALFRWVALRLPQPKPDSAHAEKVGQMLVHAGYLRSSAVRTFHVIRLSCTIAGGVLALAAALSLGATDSQPIFAMAIGLGVGSFAPSYYLGTRARNRQSAIARQLSDVLDLLVVCVEAGLGLSEAIKTVGAETERQNQEIGAELSIVSADISSGGSLGQALRDFAERTSVEDIKPLAATLIQSEQLGAQVAPALRSISDAMRNTRRLRAEEAAQKTTVKILFPLVFLIMPAMMAVIVGPAMIQIMRTLNH
jgi:tight adherence protein C